MRCFTGFVPHFSVSSVVGILLVGVLLGCVSSADELIISGGEGGSVADAQLDARGGRSGSAGQGGDAGMGGSAAAAGGEFGGSAGSSGSGGAAAAGGWAGSGGSGGGPPQLVELTGTIRDFLDTHPDFETELCSGKGFVAKQLGIDEKPVYVGHGNCTTPTGPESFNQWYRDVPDVNMRKEFPIKLERQPNGNYVYEDHAFFPIDGDLFGNQGREHNYHFTYELKTTFTYQGGEVFTFQGDDDVFVFINNQLVIDLGGVHGPEGETVELDAVAADLGISVGNEYKFHFFFAERHTSESTFRIETTIKELAGHRAK